MVSRARGFAKDPTTSFPSRAVTCGLVYSATLVFIYLVTKAAAGKAADPDDPYLQLWMVAPVLAATGLAAWARMLLGAHYPSDCIGGVVQGMLVLAVAAGFYYLEVYFCGSCAEKTCYARPSFNVYATAFPTPNFVVGLLFSTLSVALVFGAQQAPVLFWDKCHYVYGLLLPCVAFRLMFLCPRLQQHWWGGDSIPDGDPRLYAVPAPKQTPGRTDGIVTR